MLNRIRFKDIKEYTECSRLNEDLGEEKKKIHKNEISISLSQMCITSIKF